MIETAADLRAVIRELGASDPDPGVVAEKICAQLTNEEAHVVAQATLRNYVRLVLVKPPSVRQAFDDVPTQSGMDASAGAPGETAAAPERQEPADVQAAVEPVTYVTESGQRAVSPKVAAARDWAARRLRVSVHVGEHEWKHFGKCTQENVKFLIASRYSTAADNTAQAKEFERVLAEMKRHEAVTVEDLPPAVLREVLAR